VVSVWYRVVSVWYRVVSVWYRAPPPGGLGSGMQETTSERRGDIIKLLPASQGQTLALTVLHVPYSLDSGCAESPRTRIRCDSIYDSPLFKVRRLSGV